MVMHHINRMKDKNHDLSRCRKKHFKNAASFHDKNSQQIIYRCVPQHNKKNVTSSQLTSLITVQSCFYNQEQDKDDHYIPHLFNIQLEFLATTIRKERSQRYPNQKGGNKIMYVWRRHSLI